MKKKCQANLHAKAKGYALVRKLTLHGGIVSKLRNPANTHSPANFHLLRICFPLTVHPLPGDLTHSPTSTICQQRPDFYISPSNLSLELQVCFSNCPQDSSALQSQFRFPSPELGFIFTLPTLLLVPGPGVRACLLL